MKEIYYTQEKKFYLTNKEYEEAIKAWNEGNYYLCPRLDNALLTPSFRFVTTPRVEIENDIYYYINTHSEQLKYFKKEMIIYRNKKRNTYHYSQHSELSYFSDELAEPGVLSGYKITNPDYLIPIELCLNDWRGRLLPEYKNNLIIK